SEMGLSVIEDRAEQGPLLLQGIVVASALDEIDYFGGQRRQGLTLVAGDLAEEQVHRLDTRRSLVDRVDLGVPDVLLQGVVLGVARTSEHLERLGQDLVRLLRRIALDEWEQQIAAPVPATV